ncbi:hypothetical protein OSB04_015462 [Centaurea solstitialis]|uniref:Uncharacterized protein n=1 Tax=Centaurea solstitialis TaxID=347529 RepID=A0AA38W8Z5_9ASTR|nr:hypothetical protein OSB04_015462 [Centaurea solstitialis]
MNPITTAFRYITQTNPSHFSVRERREMSRSIHSSSIIFYIFQQKPTLEACKVICYYTAIAIIISRSANRTTRVRHLIKNQRDNYKVDIVEKLKPEFRRAIIETTIFIETETSFHLAVSDLLILLQDQTSFEPQQI